MSSKKLKRFLSVTLSISMALSANLTSFASTAPADGALPVTEENGVPQQTEAEEDTPEETHQHNFQYSRPLRAATCVKAGVDIYVCQNEGCDLLKGEEYRTVLKLGHRYDPASADYEEGVGYTEEVTKVATCQETGTILYTCQREGCTDATTGHTKTETTPTTDHEWNEEATASAEPTCTEPAKTYIGCKHCDAVKPGSEQPDPNRPALGHGYERANKVENTDFEKTTVDATCLTEGSTTYTCKHCDAETNGHTYTPDSEKVSALKHGYERENGTEGTDFEKTTVDASCTTPGGTTYTCKYCAEGTEGHTYIPENEKVPALKHGYERADKVEGTDFEKNTVDASCITGGSTTYTCKYCAEGTDGHTYTPENEKAPALKHGYERENGVEGTDFKKDIIDASCTENGSTIYTCMHCEEGTDGHTYTPEDSIVIGAHAYGEEKELIAEANCKEAAKYDFVCSKCEEPKGEVEFRGKIDETKHIFDGEPSIFKPATCTTTGLGRLTCTFCGEGSKFQVIESGHLYEVDDTQTVAPTCTAEGTTVKVCQRPSCAENAQDHTVTEHPAATGHDYEGVEGTPSKEATCITKGEVTKACKNGCGTTTTEETAIDPTKHKNMSTSENGEHPATCTTDKITGEYCLDCGELAEGATREEGTALGHVFDREGFDADQFETDHSDCVEVKQAATCTEAGEKVYTCPDCTVEGNTKNIPIPALSHEYADDYHPATCTENGWIQQKCSRQGCGAIEPGSYQDLGLIDPSEVATGHDFTVFVKHFREETCTRNGVAQYGCANEGCTETFNKTVPAAHKYQITTNTPPSCTTEGTIIKTCQREDCAADAPGHTVTEHPEATGHDYTDVVPETVTEATCVIKGVIKKTCKNCNTPTTEETSVDPENHEHLSTEGEHLATCTTNAINGQYCLDCGTLMEGATETPDSALGHVFDREGFDAEQFEEANPDNVEVIEPATCTEEGRKTYTCTDCTVQGNTKNVPIEALGHSYEDKYTAPTCTTNGKFQRVCSRDNCGTPEGPEQDLGELDPMLGHNLVEIPAVKPTCQTTGSTAGEKCSRCDLVSKEPTELPIDTENGHSFTELESEVEASCTEDGSETYNCTVPGCSESKTITIKAGHDWMEYFAGEAGTLDWADDDTVVYRVCTRASEPDCGVDYEVLLVMPGADKCPTCEKYVFKDILEGEEATCTEGGFEDGEKCPYCEHVFVEREPISALGHRNKIWVTTKAPTCGATGTEAEECGVCHEKTGATREVAATGRHSYKEVLTDATCTTNDIIRYVCETCNGEDPNRRPQEMEGTAFGHNFVSATPDVVGISDVCTNCSKKRIEMDFEMNGYIEDTKNKIRFQMPAEIVDTENYVVTEMGILYVTSARYTGDGSDITIDNKSTLIKKISEPNPSGLMGMRVAINVTGNTDKTLWGRGYVKVVNLDSGETEVHYTTALHGSYDGLQATP